MKRARSLWLGLLLALPGAPSRAEDFLVVLDLSGSMGDRREMEPAKAALRRVIDEVQTPGAAWGLRVFGSGCCTPDTRLDVPLERAGRSRIRDLLPSLEGSGSSPLPAALRAAREEDLSRSGAWHQTVIVVSDGLVDREGACDEARELRRKGVSVLVIGLEFSGTPEGQEILRYVAEHPDCAAGRYLRANRPDALRELLADGVAALFALPHRLAALALAIVSGYYTTRFVEFALERRTRLPRERIPRICRALFALLVLSSAGLFLGGSAPGLVAACAGILSLALSSLYLLVFAFKDATR